MTDSFEFTLNNPLTEEQWDMISDVDFDRTDRITFHTKHGKEVEFTKIIRCKDCAHWDSDDGKTGWCNGFNLVYRKYDADYYCATAERKEEWTNI